MKKVSIMLLMASMLTIANTPTSVAQADFNSAELGKLVGGNFRDYLESIAIPGEITQVFMDISVVNITTGSAKILVNFMGVPATIQTQVWVRHGKDVNRNNMEPSQQIPLGTENGQISFDLDSLETAFPDGVKYYVRVFYWYSGTTPGYYDIEFNTLKGVAITNVTVMTHTLLPDNKAKVYYKVTNNDPTALVWLTGDNGLTSTSPELSGIGTNIMKEFELSNLNPLTDYSIVIHFSNSDGSGQTSAYSFSTPVGIGEVKESLNFSLYPNPTNSGQEIKIFFQDQARAVIIYNVTGQVIYEDRSLSSTSKQLTLRGLPVGNYFCQVLDDEKISTQKFIVY